MLPTDSVLQPVVLALAFLVPGACAAAGFEWRQVRYSSRRRDWMLRIVVFSALWFALAAWPTYWLVSGYWGAVAGLRPLPGWLYLMPAVYLAAPTAAGRLLGFLAAKETWLRGRLFPARRAPTAWDHLFDSPTPGYVRCRLHSGRWVGGEFSGAARVGSYAAVGEDRQDIFIARAAELDLLGRHVLDANGNPVLLDHGVLVNAQAIEILEFTPYTD